MKLKGLCGRCWAALGAYVGGLGSLLGPLRAVLGRSWLKFACIGSGSGPKLAALGAYVSGLRSRSGPSWAEPKLAALGVYVGGLGRRSGPKLAVLGPKQSVLEAIRAKSGPNPSGNAICHSDQDEKWPKPERERDPCGRSPLKRHKPSEAP